MFFRFLFLTIKIIKLNVLSPYLIMIITSFYHNNQKVNVVVEMCSLIVAITHRFTMGYMDIWLFAI